MGTTANTLARWERGEKPLNQGWVRLALMLLEGPRAGAIPFVPDDPRRKAEGER